MEIIIRRDERMACGMIARLIARALTGQPSLVLGLATGRTMEEVYRQLVNMHKRSGLDFSRCHTFNLDEYVGLPPDNKNSYCYYMNRHLFSHINIPPENTHLPDGMATDLTAACARYEDLIRDAGGIDLQLLGVGEAGHIGFNEPLSALLSRTREKALSPTTLRQNAPFFGGNPANVPRRALTMGVGTILESKRLLLLATGENKAAIIARTLEGPITAMVSASAVQLHPRCTAILDEAAAAQLQQQDYYRWIFDNEPEWADFRNDE